MQTPFRSNWGRSPYRQSYSPMRNRGFYGRDHRYRGRFRNSWPQWGGTSSYVYLGWPPDISPYFWDYDWDTQDSQSQAPSNSYSGAPYANDYGPPPYSNPYPYDSPEQSAAQPSQEAPLAPQQPATRSSRQPYVPSQESAPSLPEPPLTVVFKDGRAPEKIHNYLLTASTLTNLDHGYHEIPLDQVDIAATEEANRAAGVAFRLPSATSN